MSSAGYSSNMMYARSAVIYAFVPTPRVRVHYNGLRFGRVVGRKNQSVSIFSLSLSLSVYVTAFG